MRIFLLIAIIVITGLSCAIYVRWLKSSYPMVGANKYVMFSAFMLECGSHAGWRAWRLYVTSNGESCTGIVTRSAT